MPTSPEPLHVFYDGACPRCRRDRDRYCAWAGAAAQAVQWVDITGRDAELRRAGVDPQAALSELHVRDASGAIHREIDAYRLLLQRIPRLRAVAWLIGLPVVRPVL